MCKSERYVCARARTIQSKRGIILYKFIRQWFACAMSFGKCWENEYLPVSEFAARNGEFVTQYQYTPATYDDLLWPTWNWFVTKRYFRARGTISILLVLYGTYQVPGRKRFPSGTSETVRIKRDRIRGVYMWQPRGKEHGDKCEKNIYLRTDSELADVVIPY